MSSLLPSHPITHPPHLSNIRLKAIAFPPTETLNFPACEAKHVQKKSFLHQTKKERKKNEREKKEFPLPDIQIYISCIAKTLERKFSAFLSFL